MHPTRRSFDDDSSDSWNNNEDVYDEPVQMGAGVMNSDYESEELHSLDESSFDSAHGEDDSDDDHPTTAEVDNSVKRMKFLVFKPVAKTEHIRFEKDMLFTSPKQFKDAIIDNVVNRGWGVGFVKNDLLRVRVCCKLGCKFVAYLSKVTRKRSYQLRTLIGKHTCNKSYKNTRFTSAYWEKVGEEGEETSRHQTQRYSTCCP